jgi:glycosyltransferase involved in cell wall biosynthesis
MLENVLILPQQPSEKIPEFLAASDACMVLLKDRDVFRTVIPSKMFEAMAMERPVILGARGEGHQILQDANCGISIDPENYHQLAEAVVRLYENPALSEFLGQNGRKFVAEHYNREKLAEKYLGTLGKVLRSAGGCGRGPCSP